MQSPEQKKAHVAMLQKEGDALKRLTLEQTIAGQITFRDRISPVTMTVICLGVVILFTASNTIDSSVLSLAVVLIVAVNAWSDFRRTATKRQIAALKEYVDIRLNELKDKNG